MRSRDNPILRPIQRLASALRDTTDHARTRLAERAAQHLPGPCDDALALVRLGILRPLRPDKLLRLALAWRRWGATPQLGYAIGAIRHPDRTAVIDERGALSFAEVERRTTRLAHGLRARGATDNTRIAVLCRNHHGMLETLLAAGKLGTDLLLLSSDLTPEEIADLLAQHRVRLLVVDGEFVHQLADLPDTITPILAWTDDTTRHLTLEHLIASAPSRPLRAPKRRATTIVLTSGTTGPHKSARRRDSLGLSTPSAILRRIPLHPGERVLLAAPLFHIWGLAAFQLCAVLGATMILHREHDPKQTLAALRRHRCTCLVAVPILLRRLLDALDDNPAARPVPALRIVASGGATLPHSLATSFQRRFGRILHNVYGSTEVACATIATPDDLQHAPGTVGRPPLGTTLRVLDFAGQPVGPGVEGHIAAENDLLFDGYTDDTAPTRRGLTTLGDLGHWDASGRVFLSGRVDDVLDHHGTPVHPQRAREAIATFPEIFDVAVTGRTTREGTPELTAHVVPRAGRTLDADTLRTRLTSLLSDVERPRHIVFLDTLPRNSVGKLVPRELPDSR